MVNYLIVKLSSMPLNYGVGTYIEHVIHGLKSKPNIAVHIIHLNDHCLEFEYQKRNNIHLYRFPAPSLKPLTQDERSNRVYVNRVADILSDYFVNRNKMVLHINYAGLYFVAEIFKEKLNAKILSTIHSIDWKFLYTTNRQIFFKYFNETKTHAIKSSIKESQLIDLSDKIIFVTNYGREEFLRIYNSLALSKTCVIYNSIKIAADHFPTKQEKLIAKQKIGFNTASFLILFVGRLTDEKGTMSLIKAFQIIAKTNKDAKLVIIGDGNFNECHQLSYGIWDQIIFTGHLTSPELELFYRAADLGIMPSLFEQCSYVSLEMMINNVPLIVSDVDGLGEIFDHEHTAIKITVDYQENYAMTININELARQMNSLIHNDQKRWELAENCSTLIRNKFDEDLMIDDVYHTIIGLFD
ncbi:glycosyltransferase [Pedobacter sp. R20-19]|uniref:glycosyltransferase n=1 Tax=Pedobacter sp. R20-19 TaxID=1270196 RepID=UPI00056AA5BC|nr:glycosyltransferase [Pedobacter sp. R20-19]